MYNFQIFVKNNEKEAACIMKQLNSQTREDAPPSLITTNITLIPTQTLRCYQFIIISTPGAQWKEWKWGKNSGE